MLGPHDIGTIRTLYDLFRNDGAMQREYAVVRDARGLAPNSGGICRPPTPEGEGTWTVRQTGQAGRILCVQSDTGNWWYVWTQPSARAIGFAASERNGSATFAPVRADS